MNFHEDIIKLAKQNTFFRKEVATGKHCQIVLMSIRPGGEIGEEVHKVDQILLFVIGKGQAILDGVTTDIQPNHVVFVNAGTKHNFTNTGTEDLKLISVYAPPQHKPGTVQKEAGETY